MPEPIDPRGQDNPSTYFVEDRSSNAEMIRLMIRSILSHDLVAEFVSRSCPPDAQLGSATVTACGGCIHPGGQDARWSSKLKSMLVGKGA